MSEVLRKRSQSEGGATLEGTLADGLQGGRKMGERDSFLHDWKAASSMRFKPSGRAVLESGVSDLDKSIGQTGQGEGVAAYKGSVFNFSHVWR